MVFIKLHQELYQQISQQINQHNLTICSGQYYLPYPEFRMLAKKNKNIHTKLAKSNIITYAEMDQLKQKERITPEQRRLIEGLRSKHDQRVINSINRKQNQTGYYFQSSKANQKSVKEITESVSFSLAFIFSFFMAGVTGYYLGTYFLGWDLVNSLMIALVFIIATITIETTLFIIKQSKKDKKVKPKKYRDYYDQDQQIVIKGQKSKVE